MLRRRIRLKRKEYRLGENAKCELCEERDIRALDIVEGKTLCRNCRLGEKEKWIIEKHHFSGRNNDEFVLEIPVNEHAILSDYQQDWPEETMSNPNRSLLYEIAAWMRAVADVEAHIRERGPANAERIEKLEKSLYRKYGKNWSKGLDEEEESK